jgi:hypothetical protein
LKLKGRDYLGDQCEDGIIIIIIIIKIIILIIIIIIIAQLFRSQYIVIKYGQKGEITLNMDSSEQTFKANKNLLSFVRNKFKTL